MEEQKEQIEEVVVKASPFRKTEESPVSLRTIGIGEIEKSPGANRDISKVIQSFPGVQNGYWHSATISSSVAADLRKAVFI